MCNLYRMRAGAADILAAGRAMTADVGNLEPRDIYPDYAAPIPRAAVVWGGLYNRTKSRR